MKYLSECIKIYYIMKISNTDAIILFKQAKTVEQLKKLIKKNCTLWFDEDATIRILNKCFFDVKKLNNSRTFGTFLIDEEPFLINFEIFPDGSVLLVDKTTNNQPPSDINEVCTCGVLSPKYRCGRCARRYCSTNCQKLDWEAHKINCRKSPPLEEGFAPPSAPNLQNAEPKVTSFESSQKAYLNRKEKPAASIEEDVGILGEKTPCDLTSPTVVGKTYISFGIMKLNGGDRSTTAGKEPDLITNNYGYKVYCVQTRGVCKARSS